jgi:hypothetical protein
MERAMKQWWLRVTARRRLKQRYRELLRRDEEFQLDAETLAYLEKDIPDFDKIYVEVAEELYDELYRLGQSVLQDLAKDRNAW